MVYKKNLFSRQLVVFLVLFEKSFLTIHAINKIGVLPAVDGGNIQKTNFKIELMTD